MIRSFTKAYILIFLIAFSFSNAQPGMPATPYCYPLNSQCPCNNPGPSNMPGNFVNDFIHSVITFSGNVNISNLNSGCNSQNFPSIGCRNYIYHKCQHNLSVNAGQVVSFSVQVGQIYAQGLAIYIDWNGDNVFSNPSEQVAASIGTIPAGSWGTFTITIPPAQPNGTYRMRFRCAAGINGNLIDPCNNYTGGEAEDYDVYVGTTSPVISNLMASSNSTICSGNTLSLTTTFTSQCTPSYTWAGPNGFTSNSQNPNILNAQTINSGNYTVTVSCGTACPVSATTSVIINQAPTTSNAGSIICTCATSAVLNANTPSIGTGSWTLLSGSAVITTPTLETSGVTAIGIGTNVLQWTITNGPCVSSSTMAIIRDAMPTIANAGPDQTITCAGSSATMQANTPSIGVGTWSLISGSGTFASPNSPTSIVTGIGSGTNVYQWTITNPTYCNCQPGSSSTLSVINYTAVNVNATSSSSIACSNFSVSLNASGANSYTWTGSTFTGNIQQATINVPSGSYTVQGATGSCSGSFAVVIGTASPLMLGVSISNLSVCPGMPTTLIVNGAQSYSWSPCIYLSSCTGSIVVSNPMATTFYTITGLNSYCSGTAIISPTVIQAPLMGVSSTSTLLCAGDQATLTAFGALGYTWVPAGNGPTIAISPTISTTYTVIGSGTTACTSSIAIAQNVSPCTNVIDNSPLEGIRVFPNPAGDVLNFSLFKKTSIRMMDVNGKMILRGELKDGDKVDISILSKGIYFLYFDKDTEAVKIIKE